MKKNALLILIYFYCQITYGQISKTNIGIELTPTIASLKVKPLSNVYDPRISFSTGFTVERFINAHFSLKSGLIYERKGAKADVLSSNSTVKI